MVNREVSPENSISSADLLKIFKNYTVGIGPAQLEEELGPDWDLIIHPYVGKFLASSERTGAMVYSPTQLLRNKVEEESTQT